MAKSFKREIIATINILSQSEKSTAETLEAVQELVDTLAFDPSIRALVEVKMLPEEIHT